MGTVSSSSPARWIEERSEALRSDGCFFLLLDLVEFGEFFDLEAFPFAGGLEGGEVLMFGSLSCRMFLTGEMCSPGPRIGGIPVAIWVA